MGGALRQLLRRLARSSEAPVLHVHSGVGPANSPFVLRVLVFCQDGQFLAQGIEFDINAQAPTEKQAVQSYLRMVQMRARHDIAQGREPLAGIPSAPKRYIDAWARLEQQHLQASESFTAEPASDVLGLPAFVIHALAKNSSDLVLNR